MVTYKNSFYNKNYQDSKHIIETSAKPIEYKGYLIYHRNHQTWDIVKDGVCVGMNAGPNGAREKVDNLIKGII